MHLTRLCVCTPYPSLIRALRTLRAFILINKRRTRVCLVLLEIPFCPLAKKFNIVRNDHGHTQRRKFSVLDPKHPCSSKLKLGTPTSSNMQNSMVIFTFSVFDQKHPFWVNFAQKIKIVTLSWTLVPMLVWICKSQWWCSLWRFSIKNTFLGTNLVQKTKIVSLSWNLVPRLIRIMAMLIFSFFDQKDHFGANLLRENKIFSLSWNLVPRLDRICTVQWLYLLFLFYTLFVSFMQKICWHCDVTWLISQKLNLPET